jgi:outer membrane receptor protein involved in Fe transport
MILWMAWSTGHASLESEQPLIYVDGVLIGDGLPELDPSSIERIKVLKGEAALAMYGDETSGSS